MTDTTARLAGRTVLLTGAAGGFGRELARGFIESGASVAGVDVDASGLAAVVTELADGAHDGKFWAIEGDLRSGDACRAVVQRASSRFGRIDILVNNAALGMGIIRRNHHSRAVLIEEIDPSIWDAFAAVNFSAAWHLTRAVIEPMKRNHWGRIVSVTTNLQTMLRPGFHPYGPCKAGLEAMAAGHAEEFRGTGVTVNVVVPGGPAATSMVPEVSAFPPGTLLSPGIMIPPVLWLCTDEAKTTTGKRLVAARWEISVAAKDAASRCSAPIGWPVE